MKSLFNTEAYNEIQNRIQALNENSQPKWGKMEVGQMAYHCQMPLNILLGNNNYNLKPNWFFKTFFKKSMYNDKLWRKNLPTAPGFKITDTKDFNKEQTTLLELINNAYQQRDREIWQSHPVFGQLTSDEWGEMQYKHLDHHLRQFGA